MQETLFESRLDGLEQISRGKVRDIYAVDERHMLIVTSDRLSAFDVVLPTPIPGKGAVLTEVSNFWFHRTRDLIPNHLADLPVSEVLNKAEQQRIEGRAVVVKRLKPLPIEAIVRGYIVGSGWKDYRDNGAVGGIQLPQGLKLADRLPEPIYTPSTKANVGEHDENVDFDYTANQLGQELAQRVREVSLRIYASARDYAAERGIIIADTKFEFGLDETGALVLIDEVLTPDSSRFWPVDQYRPGTNPPSFDKQYVRDYLETLDWDKTPPGPELPKGIVTNTAAKYAEAKARLLGHRITPG